MHLETYLNFLTDYKIFLVFLQSCNAHNEICQILKYYTLSKLKKMNQMAKTVGLFCEEEQNIMRKKILVSRIF